jgi:hypothetical protein
LERLKTHRELAYLRALGRIYNRAHRRQKPSKKERTAAREHLRERARKLDEVSR